MGFVRSVKKKIRQTPQHTLYTLYMGSAKNHLLSHCSLNERTEEKKITRERRIEKKILKIYYIEFNLFILLS